jgi:hypothetical protein
VKGNKKYKPSGHTKLRLIIKRGESKSVQKGIRTFRILAMCGRIEVSKRVFESVDWIQ